MADRPNGDVHLSRRTVLGGGIAMLVAGTTPAIGALATRRAPIDVHHHFLPPFYKPLVEGWYRSVRAAVAPAMAWTPEDMIANLDAAGGVRALLSISAPATTVVDGPQSLELARRCNDYAAELASRRPRQLGFFVTLPMPDVTASIAEIERSLPLRGAVGVGLLTSYGGRYLGDPAFEPLMAYLEQRRLIAFVHPTTGPCCAGLPTFIGAPLIEFPNDTARAIGNLLWSGSLARYPGSRWVFSHGGGATAMLTERLQLQGAAYADAESRVPGGVDARLRRLYVDTASVTRTAAIAAVRAQFGDDHVMFGTDSPWGAVAQSLGHLERLGLAPQARESILCDNAQGLFGSFN